MLRISILAPLKLNNHPSKTRRHPVFLEGSADSSDHFLLESLLKPGPIESRDLTSGGQELPRGFELAPARLLELAYIFV